MLGIPTNLCLNIVSILVPRKKSLNTKYNQNLEKKTKVYLKNILDKTNLEITKNMLYVIV